MGAWALCVEAPTRRRAPRGDGSGREAHRRGARRAHPGSCRGV